MWWGGGLWGPPGRPACCGNTAALGGASAAEGLAPWPGAGPPPWAPGPLPAGPHAAPAGGAPSSAQSGNTGREKGGLRMHSLLPSTTGGPQRPGGEGPPSHFRGGGLGGSSGHSCPGPGRARDSGRRPWAAASGRALGQRQAGPSERRAAVSPRRPGRVAVEGGPRAPCWGPPGRERRGPRLEGLAPPPPPQHVAAQDPAERCGGTRADAWA